MNEATGWLLDVYTEEDGIILWLLADDDQRLQWINRLYGNAGLALLARADPGRPLTVDNLGRLLVDVDGMGSPDDVFGRLVDAIGARRG